MSKNTQSIIKISLSLASDIATVFAWDVVALGIGSEAAILVAKKFLSNFFAGLKPNADLPRLNTVVELGNDAVKGKISLNDWGYWGEWLLEYIVPFVGTNRLINEALNKKEGITQIEVEDLLVPSDNNFIGSSSLINGIFYNDK